MRERRPDIVHLHSSFAGAVGALAIPRGVPLIYTPHGLAFARTGVAAPVRAVVRGVEALIARRSALLGAVSEAEAELARSGLHAPRVAVVRNGIPELDGDRSGAAPERPEPVVVAMGRITAARQPAASARILSALSRDARVGWIGGGEDDAPLRAAGIPVTGWLPRAEALERLGEATVCLHWSAWDGQSLALLEAFARDVVVVASDIAANREVVGPRQICARRERRRSRSRARSSATPRLRAELLADQRSRAAAFGAGRAGAEWLELYAQVLAKPLVANVQLATAASGGPKIGGPWT